jgi:hypothetical protein
MSRFLKPCLCCKEKYQIILKSDDESFYFVCDKCDTHGPKAKIPKQAEELWNGLNDEREKTKKALSRKNSNCTARDSI